MTNRHFQCRRCDERPDTAFAIFRADGGVEDWLIVFAEQQLMHIHFGGSTVTAQDNIAEAKFVDTFLRTAAAAHPEHKYYIVLDATGTDNSEFVPPESLAIYRDVLRHPQFGDGVIYGATAAFNAIIHLLTLWSTNEIKTVASADEAEAAYQQWWAKGERTI